jgi:4-carboxymuconolactone decarboxylase
MRDTPGPLQALTPAQGALVTLSAAVASGDAASIESEAARAIEAEVSPDALYEALLQSYLFLGFPRAIEAFFAARPVLDRTGARPDSSAAAIRMGDWESAGEGLCRKVYGKNYDKLMETMRGLSPDLASSMILEGYGKTLSRPALGTLEREYCVVASLTVTRMERQLRSHAIGAVNVGGTRAGVREAILLTRPWAGDEAVSQALRVAGLTEKHARE